MSDSVKVYDPDHECECGHRLIEHNLWFDENWNGLFKQCGFVRCPCTEYKGKEGNDGEGS